MQSLFDELGLAIVYLAVGASYVALITWFMMAVL